MTNDDGARNESSQDHLLVTDPDGAGYAVPIAALGQFRIDDALWTDFRARLGDSSEDVEGFAQYIGVFPRWRATSPDDWSRAWAQAFGQPWKAPADYYPKLH